MNQNFRNPLSERMSNIVDKKCPQIIKKQNRNLIFPKDLLCAILDQPDSPTCKVLEIAGINIPEMKMDIQKIKINQDVSFSKPPHLHPFSIFILSKADKIASEMKSESVGTEHVILSILAYMGKERSITIYKEIFSKYGLGYSNFKNAVKNYLLNSKDSKKGHSKMNDTKSDNSDKKNAEPQSFLKNINEHISKKNINFIGRDKEIERLSTILSRKNKNNAIIVGEEGVGKTILVEGFVKKIIDGKVPNCILNSTVFSLDIGGMIAGTKYRGQFEERMKNVIKFLSPEEEASSKKYILFIDEIHQIINAGSAEGAPLDAGAILKTELTGNFRCIGTTTTKEYKNYILQDPPLARRFSPIFLDEPSIEDAIEILSGIKEDYENHHKVKIKEDILRTIVVLSDRYIKDRKFPDKAIDVMDEACAKKVISKMSLDEYYDIEKNIKSLRKNIEEHKDKNEYEKCAELVEERNNLVAKFNNFENEFVDLEEEDINKAISEITGIPLGKNSKDEQNRLLKMEDHLNEIIINQQEAINKVCMAVQRGRAGLKDPDKPAGIFLFLGDTGIGKTITAKNLAKYLFGKEDKLIRLDMSEYMEKHTISKIIGAPPSYVGYGDYGKLTDFVRSRPYSVILLDEFEKAHPDIANLFLQVYDDGRMTDSSGNCVDFRNTIIIMTSNIGSDKLNKKSMGFGDDSGVHAKKERDAVLMSEVKKRFLPEFMNRIDEIVIFNSLNIESMSSIFNIEFSKVVSRLKEKGIEISCNEMAKKFLISKGFDEKYGARPLKRTIRNMVENELAGRIIKGDLDTGKKIVVSYLEGSENLDFFVT